MIRYQYLIEIEETTPILLGDEYITWPKERLLLSYWLMNILLEPNKKTLY
jgi:hypothetical protein